MANSMYPIFKTSLGTAAADVSLNVNTVQDGPYVALIDTSAYTFNVAHDFFNDLAGIIGTDQRIVNPTFGTVAQGVFDGDNVTFTAVSGNSVEALAFYRHNAGANTTWRTFLFLDTGQTNLPVTPNGGNITITWDAAGIFGL